MVNRVSVCEVHSSVSWCLISENLHESIKLLENFVSVGSLEILVIVPLIIISSILLPVISDNVLDRNQLACVSLVFISQNLQPAEYSPETVLLTNVEAACAETFLTTD